MTKDELKRKLRSAFVLNKLLEADLAQLQNMRDSVGKITPAYSLAPGGGGIGQRIENETANIVDMESTIRSDRERLAKARAEIIKLIMLVDDPLLNRILDKRYLQYQKWELIAVELGYAWAQIHRLHSKALGFILKKMIHYEIE